MISVLGNRIAVLLRTMSRYYWNRNSVLNQEMPKEEPENESERFGFYLE